MREGWASPPILFTKFDHWAYEDEIRTCAQLDEQEDGLYYRDFDESLRLVQVIAGHVAHSSPGLA